MFYQSELVKRARVNAGKYPWADAMQRKIVQDAQPWMNFADDELWALMFGNTIRRSWMVWSNGHCPSCKESVPMYNWRVDALKEPWKFRCPHCKEAFPKNDFHKFYLSGLDEHGIFDLQRADRSPLFNAEHPDPHDPLHKFGVDDGEGCVEGDRRWRFIGAYLIYGQWKQAVVGGITKLAAAHVITGDPEYAHKAGVLLDRVADLYPTFDFGKEGVMYEGPPHAGYVSTWHDACEETRQIALAYDQVREALSQDKELVTFLARKARENHNPPKDSWEDIKSNIEDRILSDAIKSPHKIHSNYPRTSIAAATILSVLDWREHRDEVNALLDEMIEKATAVDGVTGEKGLSGYTVFTIRGLADFLELYARLDPGFLPDLFKKHPSLRQTYRFHIDTWCMQQYYPQVGDTGSFAAKVDQYAGVAFSKQPGLEPSMFTFMWRLYELTGDPAYVQALYKSNNGSVENLPYDLFAEDPEAFQKKVGEVIAREGELIRLGSVDKKEWHIAILRSGEGENARAAWLAYDSGGGHAHMNGMNLGLFAKGLDLMPDFGYPPVQYGGWGSPRSKWYSKSAAHNTVVVDGRDHETGLFIKLSETPHIVIVDGQNKFVPAAGHTTLWADGKSFKALRSSGPEIIKKKQFERTVVMPDISDRDFYLLDIFRVGGGKDHAKFFHSHFGKITSQGLSLKPAAEYGHETVMRNFQSDSACRTGWSVDWKIEDRYRLLPPGAEVHLRYTDLTSAAQAYTTEGWVSVHGFVSNEEVWIPRIMVRRQSDQDNLASAFVAVIEAYEKASNIAAILRLDLQSSRGASLSDQNVAVEIRLLDGRRDLVVGLEVEDSLGASPLKARPAVAVLKEWNFRSNGELCWVRKDAEGTVQRVALCKGSFAEIGDVAIRLERATDFVEVSLDGTLAQVVAGEANIISEVSLGGKLLPLH